MNNNEKLAKELCAAIRTLAENPERLENFESYLSYHFETWFEKYANTPENLVAEIKQFAEMEV